MNIDPEVRRPARLRSSFYAGGMYRVDGVGLGGALGNAVSDLRMTANLNRYVKEVP
jgi:hypothetical protein